MNAPPTSLSHLGFDSWVTCEGAPVPVYGVELHGNKMTCWIASEAGKEFAVHTKLVDKSVKRSVNCRVSVDGSHIAGHVLGTISPCVYSQSDILGPPAGPASYHKLKFATLSTSDEDSAVKDNAVLVTLGTISVTINRCTLLSKVLQPASQPRTVHKHLQPGNLTVHEKAKKLGGHHATLGDIKQASAPRLTISTRDLEPAGSNFVVFEFKYRPKDVLQAQDIIPVERQPSPVLHPEPAKRKRESAALGDTTNGEQPARKLKQPKTEAGAEDPAVLRARIRELQAKLDAQGESVDVKPKVEPIRARSAFSRDQVIDLTEDD